MSVLQCIHIALCSWPWSEGLPLSRPSYSNKSGGLEEKSGMLQTPAINSNTVWNEALTFFWVLTPALWSLHSSWQGQFQLKSCFVLSHIYFLFFLVTLPHGTHIFGGTILSACFPKWKEKKGKKELWERSALSWPWHMKSSCQQVCNGTMNLCYESEVRPQFPLSRLWMRTKMCFFAHN